MKTGVQKAFISGGYQVDIRLLDPVNTWLFSAIFQVFYTLTTIF